MNTDGSKIEIVAFSDNPKTDEMFNGEHSFIYVDNSNGELRLRRQWFLDSGMDENTDRVKVTKEGEVAEFEGIRDLGGFNSHQGKIRKASKTELLMEGEVIAGERRLPYSVRLTKRLKT